MPLRADDEARTRDLNLGKVALYQLSYVRLLPGRFRPGNDENISGDPTGRQIGVSTRVIHMLFTGETRRSGF